MGQRLNFEIVNRGLITDDDKSLNYVYANAYYHWCGYTDSSLLITECVVNTLNQLKNHEEFERLNPIQLSVLVLSNTQAGLDKKEIHNFCDILNSNKDNIDVNTWNNLFSNVNQCGNIECIDGWNIPITQNRNLGIISITEVNKYETREWEEARVEYDMNEDLIYFDAWCYTDDIEGSLSANDEKYDNITEYLDSLVKIPKAVYYNSFKSDDIYDVIDAANDAINNGQYRMYDDENKLLYEFIC